MRFVAWAGQKRSAGCACGDRRDGGWRRDRGTPQVHAVSPVLANLFMHYAFNAWMAWEYPGIQ